MKSEKSAELFRYWDRLRDGRPAPRRTEIEPADIRTLLADTFILESDQRGRPVFRLAGTRLCAMFGRELKSFVFDSLWLEKDRRLLNRLTMSAFNAQSVTVVSFAGMSRGGRQAFFEMILLPLHGGGDGARALGLAVPLDKPFWIGVDPIEECRMMSVRVVDPDREQAFLTNRPEITVPSLAPDESALPQTGARRVRHLLVLDGGLTDR